MINAIFELQRKSRIGKQPSSVKDRIEKLEKLQAWILRNRNIIKDALYKDFHKPFEETDLSEIYPVLSEIRHAKKNLKKWQKAKSVKKTLVLFTHSAFVRYEPKGVVLIISPWNYPFLLPIGPLVSAIAAGNSVIIKPSEISDNTSNLIDKMIMEIFEKSEVAAILGGKQTAVELLKLPFDHIFFTGSTEVGREIAEAAGRNLITTTLELGGKSPVIVDQSADLEISAQKVVWGKFLNKGQTCIAPDYVLVDKVIREKFTKLLIGQIKKLYGDKGISRNGDYAKIINVEHHQKLFSMFEEATANGSKLLYGGKFDAENRFIEPTLILTNCKTCKISEHEIFGPLLPIIEYDSIQDAIDWINHRNPPLAIYIFSKNRVSINNLVNATQSGGVGINEVVLQFGHQNLPFGGVKHSGAGRCHGFEGFKSFSNERSYLKSGRLNLIKIIYPPFTKTKRKIIDLLVRYL